MLRYLQVGIPEEIDGHIIKMPFVITEYSNGMQIADIENDYSDDLIPLDRWVNQKVTIYPDLLTIDNIIRKVADQEGVHVDSCPDEPLKNLQMIGPAGFGLNKLFIVALSRLVQQMWLSNEVFGLDVYFVTNRTRIPNDLAIGRVSRYHYQILQT